MVGSEKDVCGEWGERRCRGEGRIEEEENEERGLCEGKVEGVEGKCRLCGKLGEWGGKGR